MLKLGQLADQDVWGQHVAPIHPKYFFRMTLTLLVAAFILFSSLLVYVINVEKS